MRSTYTQITPIKENSSYLYDELYSAITKDKSYFDFIQQYALDGLFIIDIQKDYFFALLNFWNYLDITLLLKTIGLGKTLFIAKIKTNSIRSSPP